MQTIAAVIFFFIFSFSILSPFVPPERVAARNVEYEQKTIPAYAKWGRLAMQETKRKYPNAQIIDYLHVGRIENPQITTETFKLWLKQTNREFGVYVTIEFETKSEKVLHLSLKETNQ